MPPRFALLVALMTLALPLLAPTANADHVYTHRFVVMGRVVDSEGAPVSGLTVNPSFEGLETEGSCDARQPETQTEAFGPTVTKTVTNEFGEFIICAHAHRMNRVSPGTLTVTIPEVGVSRELPVDPNWRHAFLPIQLAQPHPAADHAPLAANYTVVGRLWRPTGEISMDNIPAWGETIDQTPVTVTLEVPGEAPRNVTTRTNNYGDFAVRIPVEERIASGTVRVTAGDQVFTAPVAPELGVTYVRGEFPEASSGPSFRTIVILSALVLAGSAIAATWIGVRRWQAARELERTRARSTRRRAQR